MKKQNQATTYYFNFDGSEFTVTIELLKGKKDVNGNPYYQATITNLHNLKLNGKVKTSIYVFKGHYCGEEEEARFILNGHLNVTGDNRPIIPV